MHKLSDTVDRKFIESIDVNDWEIETDSGWQDISHIHKTIEYRVYELTTESGLKLECADTHILFDENFNEIFAKDALNEYIQTINGPEKVTSIKISDSFENMFDLTVNSSDHRFYTNGILSHNSTTSAAYLLWFVLFNPKKTVAILGNKAAIAREILERITLMLENIPFFLQPGCRFLNKGSITFSNTSRIITAATSSSSIRGYTIDVLFLDEFAFIDKADEFFTSTYPVVSSGMNSKVIITSTPNGLNLFHKLYMKGKLDPEGSGWYSLKYDWRSVPGRDEEWERKTRATISEEQFAQEFEGSFLGSSNTLIPPGAINSLVALDPIREGLDHSLRIYEEPIKNEEDEHVYVMVVDTSRGKGLDNSAFSIIDVTKYPFKQVATYYNSNISPLIYPQIISSVATLYNNARVLIETNDLGESIATDLNFDLEYENIISTKLSNNSKSTLGVRTTKKVKAIGCSTLKDLISNNKLIVNDEWTIKEMSGFIQQGSSYAADNGFNDDLMMTLVLFAWYTTTQDFLELKTDFNKSRSVFGTALDKLEEELVPFGFIRNGIDDKREIEIESDGTVWTNVSSSELNVERNETFTFSSPL